MVPVAVDVLGPLRLTVAGTPVDVRGPKRRAVLALLALAQGRAVTVDHLLDALWPDDPPDSGRAALQSHISRLRGHLGPAANRLETLGGGYRLTLTEGELDAARARVLLARARAEPAAALDLLREARALWRGPALTGLTDVGPLAASATALDDLHREVTDRLVACAVETGRLDGAVDLAAGSVAADPLREPAVLLLVRALASAGRAADALAAAREYRLRLAEETGLDPSPVLGELERAVAGGAVVPARTAPARPATRLVGRETQLAELRDALARERLVTLVGPGGVGKTRLALELARDAAEPAVLLLAPVTDPAAVPQALAVALRLQVVRGDVLAACVAHLAGGPRLLVVDNCEHLLDAARDTVCALLDGCPELTVLATSREPLWLADETPYRLPPLRLPDGRGPVEDVPAVAVFLERAARVRPGFAPGPDDLQLVADVVRRLDGMPLAIELAAGRLSGFSLRDLHDRLDRALDLLSGGRRSTDARHRTLRATVEWSYTLLGPDEQCLFRHLSVFVDGVDLATAEDVAAELDLAGDPGAALARLVDASMIEVVFGGTGPGDSGTRYRMLETLRAFGLDRLAAAGEDHDAADRLVRWAVAVTEHIERMQQSDREPEADAALRRELANLRAAWRLIRERGDLDAAAAVAVGLAETAAWRDLTEPRTWAAELAADPAIDGHPRAAAVLGGGAYAAYYRGDYTEADRLARAGLALRPSGQGVWACRTGRAIAALAGGAFAEVVEHAVGAAESDIRPAGSLALAGLGALYGGDLARARELQARAAALAVCPTNKGFAAYVAGEIDNLDGIPGRGEAHYLAALDHFCTSGATFGTGIARVGLLSAYTRAGRVRDALRGFRNLVDYWERAGNWTHMWTTLRNLADLLRTLDDPEPAALIDAAADIAPDAPPPPDGREPVRAADAPGRAQALAVARTAIARHLPDRAGSDRAGSDHPETKNSARTQSV